jgi:hypothetical protein
LFTTSCRLSGSGWGDRGVFLYGAIVGNAPFRNVSVFYVVDNAIEFESGGRLGSRKMHRFVVNARIANIFNRVFEVQESAQNAENLTENRVFETHVLELTTPALTMLPP